MLQTISWKEYLITIGLTAGLYYCWWLIRYYPGVRRGKQGTKRGKGKKGERLNVDRPEDG